MRYFRIVYYAGEGDYETKSVLIDEPKFRVYQKAMLDDASHLMLENRTIKMSSIKEVEPADDEVKELVSSGTPLKRLGLPELPLFENKNRLDGTVNGFQKMGAREEFIKKYKNSSMNL